MKPFKSLKKIDEILSNRYPTQKDLERLPLGEKLVRLDRMAWTSEIRCIELSPLKLASYEEEKITTSLIKNNQILEGEIISDVFRKHITGCMKGVQLLTTGIGISDFFKDFQKGVEPFKSFETFLATLTDDDREFLRFVTLYHDIGKVIHRDKHPMLSKHLLESIEDKERERFIKILGGESKFYLMLELVGHHDLFGTICTGEASRTSIIEASGLRLKKIEDVKKTIDYLVILNLSDIYGTIGRLPTERLELFIEEQLFFDGMINSTGTKSLLENRIIESEQEPERTTERIKRILISGIKYLSDKDIEAEVRDKLCEKVTNDMIRSTIVKLLGPELQSFCRDFALVCKLDYSLRFIKSLCKQWISNNKITKHTVDNYRLDELATIILEILIRLVRSYSDLTRQRDGRLGRIGLELLGLSRSKEISDYIIERLLLGVRRAEGVNWIADEITAWYYI